MPLGSHQMGDPLARSFAQQSLALAEESGSARREASALRALVRVRGPRAVPTLVDLGDHSKVI